MRVFLTRTGAGVDSLVLEEMARPGALAAGQIRIAMRAASINYRDFLTLGGVFGVPPEGLIPCSDGAGEVIEIAPDVTRVKLGDRVALTFNPDWIEGPFVMSANAMGRGGPSLPGVMRDEIVAGECEAVLLPAHFSFEDGAAIPCAGVTAWHALCGSAPLLAGMSVLTQGTGGVSLFALQFAKLLGARVIATTSSVERCALLKRLGADEAINYNETPDWDRVAREMTGGQGVDVAVDIGGTGTIERSIAATRRGGRVAPVGLITGRPTLTEADGVTITPMRVGSRADFEAIVRTMSAHGAKPVIDSRFSFEQLPQALTHLQSGKHVGKIVLSFGG